MPGKSIQLFLIILILSAISVGCATPRMMAVSTEDVTVDPSGRIGALHSAGLTLRAAQTDVPSNLGRKMTAVRLTASNASEYPMEFIPKEIVLLDQYNRQFFPLGPDALLEAAGGVARPTASVYMGYGWGRSTYYSHGMIGYRQPFYWHDYPYPPPRSSYQGLIAQSLPLGPITIQPHASVSGVLYFPVPLTELLSVELRVARFLTPPTPDAPAPQQAVHSFRFNVVK